MSLASIIVIIGGGLIFFVSIIFGGNGKKRNDVHSEWSWVIFLLTALGLEGYLITFRDHTLSSQMQYWVKQHPLSGFLVVFWGWLAYHFVLEPTIRFMRSMMERFRS